MTLKPLKIYALRFGVPIGTAAALLLLLGIALGGGVGKNSLDGNIQGRKPIIEKVRKSPDFPISVDNSEDPPILIQAASVKEITGAKYQKLTGNKTDSIRHVTFPNVKLINNTNQTVTAFLLLLLDKHSNKNRALMFSTLNLEPFKDFSVEPLDWAKPRKQMLRRFAKKEGTFQEDKSPPDWNSEEMWLPGGASEFSVLVGRVWFADGTEWMIKP